MTVASTSRFIQQLSSIGYVFFLVSILLFLHCSRLFHPYLLLMQKSRQEGRREVKKSCMHYMVIERFKEGKVKEVYQRFAERGRLMPAGVHYINSWTSEDFSTCYQVMETDDVTMLEQ